jgi:hypothetical protein
MKNMNAHIVRIGIIFLLLIFVSSSGCVKNILNNTSGKTETQLVSPAPTAIDTPSSSGTVLPGKSPATPPIVVVTTPPGYIEVDQVDPGPYVTPDPYKLPYRDHGTWSTGEPDRATRIPQFTKSYVLRTDPTAIRVNVTEAPLVIDLTFRPRWADPDHTGTGSTANEDGSVTTGTSVNSFVYSTAVVTVYSENSHAIVEQDGYGKEFSVDLEKKITLYQEGSYIITLTGDFMDVNMAIITGSALTPVIAAPTSGTNDWEE